MGHLGKFAVVLVGRAATINRPFNNYVPSCQAFYLD